MRVKSGFKQKRKRSKSSSKVVMVMVGKRMKKILSFNLFALPGFRKLKPVCKRKDPRSYLRKDVKRKTFNNPYSNERKRKLPLLKLLQAKRYLIAQTALIVTIVVWLFVLFVQPTFYLVSIRVDGTKEINPDDIVRIAYDHMKGRSKLLVKHAHLFFLNESELEETIRARYGLDQVTFTTHWPSKSLHIALEEKSSILGYSINDSYFTIDRLGTVIREVDANTFATQTPEEQFPVIYHYDQDNKPEIGSQVLDPGNIQTISNLYENLSKYTGFSIHSFRLREVAKDEIVIPEKIPEIAQAAEPINDEVESSLDELAESIANAESIDEKIANIKEKLEEIDIEKIEEGSIDKYLEREKRFVPNDDIRFDELEVYTNQGWTIKLGSSILTNPDETEKLLNIFATLNGEVDLGREVKDYIDLRFSNRIYYR